MIEGGERRVDGGERRVGSGEQRVGSDGAKPEHRAGMARNWDQARFGMVAERKTKRTA